MHLKRTRTIALGTLLSVVLAASFPRFGSARDADIGWGPTITTDANIYLSSNGNDSNNGTIGSPVQSFSRARDLANAAEAASSNGVTVWLRAGWFTQPTTFTFNSTDGGTATKPIIWRAYPNESVVITGARTVDPSKWSSYSGPTGAGTRLNPAVTAANIQQCNLSDLHLSVSGSLPNVIDDNGNGFIQYTNLPGLYWNGPRLNLSRYPKNGFMEAAAVDNNGNNGASPVITYKTDPSQLYHSTNSIGRESAWVNAVPHGAWLKGYWYVAWENTTMKILAIDTGAKTITMSPHNNVGSYFGFGHEPYYIINLLEEISKPGDWCVDTADGKIYFYAPSAINSANLRISDNVNPMFVINGANYLQFIGLEIINNRGGAFSMTNASNVQINGCSIHDVDEAAVVINGGTNCLVHSSNLYNLGAQGVDLLAAGSASSNCGHSVTNCHIYNFGVLNNIYAGAVAVESGNYGSIVQKNLVHDSPHLGLFVKCANTLFEANDVFRTSELTNDIGTFYCALGPHTVGGNIFRYNLSHNAPAADGIYYDFYGLGDTVYCNVAYALNRGFIFHQSFPNVTCTNNISYANAAGYSYLYPNAPGANISNNVAVNDTAPYAVGDGGTLNDTNITPTGNVDFADPGNLLFSVQSASSIFTEINSKGDKKQDFVNFPAGSRLEVKGSASVDISTVTNTALQHWVVTLQSNGYFELSPVSAPGKVLDVRNSGTAYGTAVQLYADGHASNQQWSLIRADGTAATAIQDGAVYQLAPKHSPSSRLDVNAAASADGTVVQLWGANGGSNQKWLVRQQPDKSFDLIPQCASGPGVYTDSYRVGIPSHPAINYSVNPPPSGA